jgi:hypothetical protein
MYDGAGNRIVCVKQLEGMCLVDINIQMCYFVCDVCTTQLQRTLRFADLRNAVSSDVTAGGPVLDSLSSTATVLWLWSSYAL